MGPFLKSICIQGQRIQYMLKYFAKAIIFNYHRKNNDIKFRRNLRKSKIFVREIEKSELKRRSLMYKVLLRIKQTDGNFRQQS